MVFTTESTLRNAGGPGRVELKSMVSDFSPTGQKIILHAQGRVSRKVLYHISYVMILSKKFINGKRRWTQK
jgi:hypothetical protein